MLNNADTNRTFGCSVRKFNQHHDASVRIRDVNPVNGRMSVDLTCCSLFLGKKMHKSM